MEPTLKNIVARGFLRKASRPLNTIAVNIWDDSPPGAPIIIEGILPYGVDKASVYEWLAEQAETAGYEVEWYTWETEHRAGRRFRILHPSGLPKVDPEEHRRFLDKLVRFYTPLVYTFWDRGHPVATFRLYVYSES